MEYDDFHRYGVFLVFGARYFICCPQSLTFEVKFCTDRDVCTSSDSLGIIMRREIIHRHVRRSVEDLRWARTLLSFKLIKLWVFLVD